MMNVDSNKEYLTQDKYNEFERELKELKTVRRKEIAEQLEYAKSLGDLSENAEYHEARDEQAQIENRIARLETLLQNAEIVSSHATDVVTVGSTVTVQPGGTGDAVSYIIVGSEEVDTDAGKISVNSPLGKGLLGKKRGDKVEIEAPRGKVTYAIVNIT